MSEIRLNFYAPGLSKAKLDDILESVVVSNRNISIDHADDSKLNADPATVALIGAAGVTVAALIQAVAQVYLEWRREQAKKSTQKSNQDIDHLVSLKVYGTLGESWTIELNDAKQIEIEISKLPSDQNEIMRIRLE